MKIWKATPLIIIVFLICLTGCKNDDGPGEGEKTIAIDSSSFSVIVVKTTSSDPTNTGLAVVDIQKLFLGGKEVGSTVEGKMFTVKKTNESLYQAAIEKVVLDLQNNESYFTNHDSFTDIFSEQFKTKTGFQKSTDLSKEQSEELFKKNLALRESAAERTSAGETFTLSDFMASMRVSVKVTNTTVSNGFLPLKRYLTVGSELVRSTALLKGDLVTVSTFSSVGSSNGYSYSYPLPPSPAPMYGAPTWFWEQMIVLGAPDPFQVMPANTTPRILTINNFSNSQNSLTFKNAKIVGSTVEIEYPASDATSWVRLGSIFDVSNGFETSFEFSGQKGEILEVQLHQKDGRGYNDFGIHNPYSPRVGLIISSVLTRRNTANLFDGTNHKVKIILANRSTTGAQVRIFVDDMVEPAYDGIYTGSDKIYSYFTTVVNQPDAERYIRLSAWSSSEPRQSGKMTIKNWTFKAL